MCFVTSPVVDRHSRATFAAGVSEKLIILLHIFHQSYKFADGAYACGLPSSKNHNITGLHNLPRGYVGLAHGRTPESEASTKSFSRLEWYCIHSQVSECVPTSRWVTTFLAAPAYMVTLVLIQPSLKVGFGLASTLMTSCHCSLSSEVHHARVHHSHVIPPLLLHHIHPQHSDTFTSSSGTLLRCVLSHHCSSTLSSFLFTAF